MSTTDRTTLMSRPLPSLAQWLGDGRADGFEDWVREAVFLERAVNDEGEAAALRMLRTMAIACMEALRQETEHHGRDAVESAFILARVAGSAVMAPVLSVMDPSKSPPWQQIADTLTEDFRHGARMMARGMEES
jgi:hypothetical protein